MKRERIDVLMVERNLAESRERAKRLIMAGKVLVNEQRIEKAGTQVDVESEIRLTGEDIPYVSRGGLKLLKAIDVFGINIDGKICMDIGASTGGFTDCMLQHGANKVYAIDVGYGQLAWKLRTDERVINFERTNIRNLSREQITDEIDLATVDVSFISLDKVLPIAYEFLSKNGELIALVKPQFEAGREKVGKHGVVRESATHLDVLNELAATVIDIGYNISGLTYSPVKGAMGNIEYLMYMTKTVNELATYDIKATVAEAHETLNARNL